MQKYLLVLVMALLTIAPTAKAQTSEHLTFKGVAIDGTLKEFVNRMKQKGFTLRNVTTRYTKLQGDFASFKECHLKVSTLNDKDLVYKIEVIFPSCETWSNLSSDYFSLKQLLTEKYGEPTDCIEEFSHHPPQSDQIKMIEVRNNDCTYFASYVTDKGLIHLSIETDARDGFVLLTYLDRINGEIIREKAKEDL